MTPDAGARADARAIFRGAGFAMAGFLIRPLARLPFLLIVGRIYGVQAFGRYVFAIGLFEALAALCRLGLRDTLFRFLAQHPDHPREVLVEAVTVAGGLSAAAALAVLAAGPLIGAGPHIGPMWRMLASLIVILPVFVATDLLLAAVRYHRVVAYEVLGRSIVEPAAITGGALAFGLAGFDAHGLLYAYMIAQGLTLAVATAGAARHFPLSSPLQRLDWSRARAMAATSMPTGLAECVGLGFNTVGVFLTGLLLGDTALGVFGMAQNLETMLSKVRQAFEMIAVPVVSRGLWERGDAYVVDQLRLITRSILSAQLPLLVIVTLFGRDILALFGKGFAMGSGLLSLMALAAVIDGVVNLAQVPLFLTRPRINLAIAVGALAINLGLGAWLIPRLGVAGAGVSLAVALGTAGLARQLLVLQIFRRALLGPRLLRPVAAAAGATALTMAVLHTSRQGLAGLALAALALTSSYLGLLAILDRELRSAALDWIARRGAGRRRLAAQ